MVGAWVVPGPVLHLQTIQRTPPARGHTGDRRGAGGPPSGARPTRAAAAAARRGDLSRTVGRLLPAPAAARSSTSRSREEARSAYSPSPFPVPASSRDVGLLDCPAAASGCQQRRQRSLRRRVAPERFSDRHRVEQAGEIPAADAHGASPSGMRGGQRAFCCLKVAAVHTSRADDASGCAQRS